MSDPQYPAPAMRRLRVYAFDPQASTQIETAGANVATVTLPWEASWEEPLTPGPVNQYLEVVDVDPVSGQFYPPVDLDDRNLLAQDGLAPTEGDPRFHQQMVFAVAMKAIKAFERALGRRVFWRGETKEEETERKARDKETGSTSAYVPKLRVYPHALREPNAYYSPQKRALLFGYFRASTTDPGTNMPGGWVFTALSHDIIAHETTHAMLDGLHPRFSEQTNRDSLAFHEAIADIVALMLHFTMPEAVKGAVARDTGLGGRSQLSGLAQQFGEATGRYKALRDAIDTDPGKPPDPTLLSRLTRPHDRGAVLVAAVFDTFVSIYQRRTADLLRLAHPGADKSQLRDLHPDLVARLTREATKAADHVLRMCLRALDYLPPVDVAFGDFLRAIVTADADLVPDDPFNYRLALIQAFRRRGILPDSCLSLAPDSLIWEGPGELDALNKSLRINLTGQHSMSSERWEPVAREEHDEREDFQLDLFSKYRLHKTWLQSKFNQEQVQKWLTSRQEGDEEAQWEKALGIYMDRSRVPEWMRDLHFGGRDYRQGKRLPVEVHSVRTTRRTGPDGQDLRQLVIVVNQQVQVDGIKFRGGATLLVDLRDGRIRYIVRKRIDDRKRLERQRAYLEGREWEVLGMTYGGPADRKKEPFAMAHRGA